MSKLILCLALCLALIMPAAVFAEEAAGSDETVRLTVWGAQSTQVVLAALINEFKQDHPDKQYDITLKAVEEPDLWFRYREDPDSLSDIFAFVSDRLIGLVEAGVLLPVGQSREAVIADNTPSSVESAMVDGVLYAYPKTEDNGYFLYYDASVLTPEDVETLDALLAAANASDKRMFMDIANGWYIVSFFFGAGCRLDIDEAGRQVCDFNSDAGVAAGEAIRVFTANPAFLHGDDATFITGIGDTICAGVSGTWNAAAVKRRLGDNYRACKLPTFTLNGQQVQMGSFIGTKLMGVNANTVFPDDADELAAFLNNEHAQLIRYKVLNMGPSNINAAAFEEIHADTALDALMDQNEFGIDTKTVKDAFWDPAAVLGQTLIDQSQTDIRALLDDMVAAVSGR